MLFVTRNRVFQKDFDRRFRRPHLRAQKVVPIVQVVCKMCYLMAKIMVSQGKVSVERAVFEVRRVDIQSWLEITKVICE